MSQIDELLRELRPGGVERVQLLDVVRVDRGRQLKEEQFREGCFPVVTASRSELRKHDVSNFGAGAVTVTSHGAYAGHVNFWATPIWLANNVLLLSPVEPRLRSKFLYYYLKSCQRDVEALARGGGVPYFNWGDLGQISIPVPPLPVQEEIVRILDAFTELDVELDSELEARKRQYAFYAGVLLASDDYIPRVRFGDVAKIARGASPRPIQNFITDRPDGVPWIKIGDVPARGKYITSARQRVTLDGAAKSRRVQPGDFVLSNSMSFGRPYICKIDGYIHDGWLAISAFDDSFIPDYLYHLLRSAPVQDEFARRAGAGTVRNLNAEIVRSINLPLPSKAKQVEVVELLDNFDAVVNDPTVGLPAELAARQKQYEYYRNKLLSFEEFVA